MKEQAALLGPKTKYLVEATVATEATEGNRFLHSFNLSVPSLQYTLQLFRVVHGVDLYPVKELYKTKELTNEEEFTQWLAERLSSNKTRQIITNLIAQARS
jgi:UDP-2,3-diacylglucosamine pyrophosphatase LpxH